MYAWHVYELSRVTSRVTDCVCARVREVAGPIEQFRMYGTSKLANLLFAYQVLGVFF